MCIPPSTRDVLRGAFLVAISCPAVLAAQPRPRAADRSDIPAAYAAIREADLRRDVYRMASPEMRGREGGTLDEMRASMWMAEQYRRAGLRPMGEDSSWFQWFDITRTRVSVTASQASFGAQPMTLFGDFIPLNVVSSEARGTVLWIPDARDTTTDVRGRIVATPVLAPAPERIRTTSYTFASRYADAAVNGTMALFARRGAAALILVAHAAVDSAFEVVASARVRGAFDVDHAVPRTGSTSSGSRHRRRWEAARHRPISLGRSCAKRSSDSHRPSSRFASSDSRRRR